MSQDTCFKPQDRQDALEKLVPKLDLCKQIPPGAFENSALVWSYSCDKRKTEPFIEERDCIGFCRRNMVNAPPVYPAPTLAEIMATMHYPGVFMERDNKWSAMSAYYSESDVRPEDAALKLWLELNKSDQSDQSDQSDTDRKGGE
jgi:hypothetical protein